MLDIGNSALQYRSHGLWHIRTAFLILLADVIGKGNRSWADLMHIFWFHTVFSTSWFLSDPESLPSDRIPKGKARWLKKQTLLFSEVASFRVFLFSMTRAWKLKTYKGTPVNKNCMWKKQYKMCTSKWLWKSMTCSWKGYLGLAKARDDDETWGNGDSQSPKEKCFVHPNIASGSIN